MEKNQESHSFRTSVQKLGTNLSSMIMPNIAMFIAWGLITALFIETGWLPNASLAEMVGPMLNYLLPVMIAYQGGKLVYNHQGGVVGAIATMGVIVGSPIPMFIGAMIMGPLGGWIIKKFDQAFGKNIKTGFEMLYNNFSAGIIGALLAILGFYAIGPAVTAGTQAMAQGVNFIIQAGLLPLANIFIEPAKILFLNNAINHGILTPLGTEQALETGKSILYLLEANPGPGLGILLAYMAFGKGSAKSSASGATIIHFLGGIHEIYFPYVMMKPALFFAVMGGGVTGTFVLQLLGAGLTAPASPGSIFAIMAMSPRGEWLPVLAGVVAGALVSFAIASLILKTDKSQDNELEDAIEQSQAMKRESKGIALDNSLTSTSQEIERVIFACDAGMGSSAMGASLLRKKFAENNIEVGVTNSAINQLAADKHTIVITQQELTDRARKMAPNASHISVDNFLQSPKYDELVQLFSGTSSHLSSHLNSNDSNSITQQSNIKELSVVYNQDTLASATMLVNLLSKEIQNKNINLRISKSPLEAISENNDVHYLVFEKLSQDVSITNKEIINDAISSTNVENILAKY